MVIVTVIELLAKRVLYRTLARIQKIRSGGISPETSAARNSPANRLPLEVVEMIIAYLVADKRSLRACTMTGRSWYIAAVPHLHRTLTVTVGSWDRKDRWPNPIMHVYMLGLFPFVEEFRVHCGGYCDRFSPKLLSRCILRKFSALTNVRHLEIQYLEIPKLIPKIQRYLKNFLPTVRSLTLRSPQGSRRQIVYFIGFFEHLQDLNLSNIYGPQGEPADDPTLIPTFVPPLQGCLEMNCICGVGLLKDMIDLFGGLRFYYVRLYDVERMSLLLEACAETLQVVMLSPGDPRGEQISLKGIQVTAVANDFTAGSSLRDFDLSQNKSLRKFKVQANLINSDPRSPSSRFLKHVLSTITSPVFSEVVITYWSSDFRGVESYNSNRAFFGGLSQAERAQEVARHRRMFEVFRKMPRAQDFLLVLRACLWSSMGEEPLRILEEAIAEEKAERGFNDFFSDPLVEYLPT